MLQPNDLLPDFRLADDEGKTVSKADLKGRRFVLFFYPKDATPGCTTEVCGFRDAHPAFGKLGVPVFGVSADPVDSHRRFAEKQGLNYRLLADPERQLIEALGVWVEKSLYGRKYMGILRSTFVVDANGRIERCWDKVDVKTHADEVLRYIRGESSAQAPARKPAANAKAVATKKPVATKKAPAGKSAPARKAAPAKKKAPVKRAAPAKAARGKALPVAKKAARKAAPKRSR